MNPGKLVFNRIIFLVLVVNSSWISPTDAQRISVEGTRFTVDGHEIFMNGVNTPWDNWNDFGGVYDHDFWDREFKRIRQAGGNSSRIWITCNGDIGINISNDGEVTGATDRHWNNLDDLFALAESHKVYIMATLISFDHTKNSNNKYQAWRNLLASDTLVGSYIKNYLIPFLNRYKDNPYLWSIDACNEIEWMHENAECGQIGWPRLQYFVARVAAAVHEYSDVLVTLGSAAVKWNSTAPGCEGNFWSDQNLQAQYDSKDAWLDFYSPHFYGWVVRWFGDFALDKKPSDYLINDRPCMVGEGPATGVYRQNNAGIDTLEVPIKDAYTGAYKNGWKGFLAWTSNGVDDNGSLDDCRIGLLNFYGSHPGLVSQSITGISSLPENSVHIKIYPNPVINFLYIDNPGHKFIKAQLYDLSGGILPGQNFYSNSPEMLDLGNLIPGMYLLNILSAGHAESIRIFKQ